MLVKRYGQCKWDGNKHDSRKWNKWIPYWLTDLTRFTKFKRVLYVRYPYPVNSLRLLTSLRKDKRKHERVQSKLTLCRSVPANVNVVVVDMLRQKCVGLDHRSADLHDRAWRHCLLSRAALRSPALQQQQASVQRPTRPNPLPYRRQTPSAADTACPPESGCDWIQHYVHLQ